MKSRIVNIECAGYTFWQLFLWQQQMFLYLVVVFAATIDVSISGSCFCGDYRCVYIWQLFLWRLKMCLYVQAVLRHFTERRHLTELYIIKGYSVKFLTQTPNRSLNLLYYNSKVCVCVCLCTFYSKTVNGNDLILFAS